MNSSKLIILDNVEIARCRDAHDLLWALDESQFDQYDNPFENKKVYHSRSNNSLARLVTFLEDQIAFAQYEFKMNLVWDKDRYYTGIFKYDSKGKLDVHVDAGIYPNDHNLRKCVTIILYLNDVREGGELQFWSGTSCASEDPKVFAIQKTIKPHKGRLVMFVNDDFAWHGISPCVEPRSLITVSFMTQYTHLFQNRREKAFFVPKPTEKWSREKLALRDRRANPETAKEVYIA